MDHVDLVTAAMDHLIDYDEFDLSELFFFMVPGAHSDTVNPQFGTLTWVSEAHGPDWTLQVDVSEISDSQEEFEMSRLDDRLGSMLADMMEEGKETNVEVLVASEGRKQQFETLLGRGSWAEYRHLVTVKARPDLV